MGGGVKALLGVDCAMFKWIVLYLRYGALGLCNCVEVFL